MGFEYFAFADLVDLVDLADLVDSAELAESFEWKALAAAEAVARGEEQVVLSLAWDSLEYPYKSAREVADLGDTVVDYLVIASLERKSLRASLAYQICGQ